MRHSKTVTNLMTHVATSPQLLCTILQINYHDDGPRGSVTLGMNFLVTAFLV